CRSYVISLNGGWTGDPEPTTCQATISATSATTRWRGVGLLHRICRRARGDPPPPCLLLLSVSRRPTGCSLLLLRRDLPGVGAGLRRHGCGLERRGQL